LVIDGKEHFTTKLKPFLKGYGSPVDATFTIDGKLLLARVQTVWWGLVMDPDKKIVSAIPVVRQPWLAKAKAAKKVIRELLT
jgi:hypothetical protein